jgi:hypothetical protein
MKDGAGDRFAECRFVAEHGQPLTPPELAEFNTLRAREMARAEARRNPPAEPDLLEDAA